MMTRMISSIVASLLVVSQGAPAPTTVRLRRKTLTPAKSQRPKNFYSATVTVGEPAQEFEVAFDLGGGTTMLPSASCRSAACLERRRYDKWASDSAADIQANGRLVNPDTVQVPERAAGRDRGTLGFLSADFGAGTAVGTFVRDRLCLGASGEDSQNEARCFPLAFFAAFKLSDAPFGAEPYDGTIGLSLEGMSVNPDFNFLDSFMRGHGRALSNSFALHLGAHEDGGEITFGGHDAQRLASPLKWVTVAEPGEGRWQVAIAAIRVGNNTLQACREGDCRAAIDYGSSLLSVPPTVAGGMEQALEQLAMPSGYGDGCQLTAMPDIDIVLENEVALTLPAEDYVSQVSASGRKGILSGPARSCKPRLAQHDFHDPSVGKSLFVLGESVLRRYRTFFDGDALQVGFSLAAGSKKASALPPPLEAGRGKEWLAGIDAVLDEEEDGKEQNPVILLVQVKLRKSKTLSSLGQ